MTDDRELIDEQIEYYRKTAPHYYEITAPPGDILRAYGEDLRAALDAFQPSGKVLEIACGTGNGTSLLLQYADSLTAIDSSEESITISREKLGNDPRVRYVVADIFSWQPDGHYDVVFFSYWLSHVPPSRFEDFWNLVATALRPGGRVFFVDEREDAWQMEELLNEEFVDHPSIPLVRRPAGEGRYYRVIKVFWDPSELEKRLRELGWAIETGVSGPFFWGHASRA